MQTPKPQKPDGSSDDSVQKFYFIHSNSLLQKLIDIPVPLTGWHGSSEVFAAPAGPKQVNIKY